MTSYFTGAGSRYNVPGSVYARVNRIGEYLIGAGYRCRTGDAIGMDEAWRRVSSPNCEFYAPLNRKNPLLNAIIVRGENYLRAKQLARQYHPYYDNLGEFERELHIRNGFELLGSELNDPSEFLIVWTPDGAEKKTSKNTGGTGQAIRIANAYDIPVFNLFHDNVEERLAKLLKQLKWSKQC